MHRRKLTEISTEIESITAVNPEYQRPSSLHPAEIGPSFPGSPFDQDNSYFDQYNWNSNTEGVSAGHVFAILGFIALIGTIISLILRKDSLNFLNFYVYQKYHKRMDIKMACKDNLEQDSQESNQDSKDSEALSPTAYRQLKANLSRLQRFKMHFALFMHFYCPIVSTVSTLCSYVRENVKCTKPQSSSSAIANDPCDSVTPSPVKMTDKDEEIMDVVIKNRNLDKEKDRSLQTLKLPQSVGYLQIAIHFFILFSFSTIIALALMNSNCLFMRSYGNNEHQCLGHTAPKYSEFKTQLLVSGVISAIFTSILAIVMSHTLAQNFIQFALKIFKLQQNGMEGKISFSSGASQGLELTSSHQTLMIQAANGTENDVSQEQSENVLTIQNQQEQMSTNHSQNHTVSRLIEQATEINDGRSEDMNNAYTNTLNSERTDHGLLSHISTTNMSDRNQTSLSNNMFNGSGTPTSASTGKLNLRKGIEQPSAIYHTANIDQNGLLAIEEDENDQYASPEKPKNKNREVEESKSKKFKNSKSFENSKELVSSNKSNTKKSELRLNLANLNQSKESGRSISQFEENAPSKSTQEKKKIEFPAEDYKEVKRNPFKLAKHDANQQFIRSRNLQARSYITQNEYEQSTNFDYAQYPSRSRSRECGSARNTQGNAYTSNPGFGSSMRSGTIEDEGANMTHEIESFNKKNPKKTVSAMEYSRQGEANDQPSRSKSEMSSFGQMVQQQETTYLKKEVYRVSGLKALSRFTLVIVLLLALCFDLYCLINLTQAGLSIVILATIFSTGIFICMQLLVLTALTLRQMKLEEANLKVLIPTYLCFDLPNAKLDIIQKMPDLYEASPVMLNILAAQEFIPEGYQFKKDHLRVPALNKTTPLFHPSDLERGFNENVLQVSQSGTSSPKKFADAIHKVNLPPTMKHSRMPELNDIKAMTVQRITLQNGVHLRICDTLAVDMAEAHLEWLKEEVSCAQSKCFLGTKEPAYTPNCEFLTEENKHEEVRVLEEQARLKMIEMAKLGKDNSFNISEQNMYGSPGKRVGDLVKAQLHLQNGFRLNPAFGSGKKQLAEECASAEAENMIIDEMPIFASDLKKKGDLNESVNVDSAERNDTITPQRPTRQSQMIARLSVQRQSQNSSRLSGNQQFETPNMPHDPARVMIRAPLDQSVVNDSYRQTPQLNSPDESEQQPDIALESYVTKSEIPGLPNIGNCNRFVESKEDPNSRRSGGKVAQGTTNRGNAKLPKTDKAHKGRDITSEGYHSQGVQKAKTTAGQRNFSPDFNSIPQNQKELKGTEDQVRARKQELEKVNVNSFEATLVKGITLNLNKKNMPKEPSVKSQERKNVSIHNNKHDSALTMRQQNVRSSQKIYTDRSGSKGLAETGMIKTNRDGGRKSNFNSPKSLKKKFESASQEKSNYTARNSQGSFSTRRKIVQSRDSEFFNDTQKALHRHNSECSDAKIPKSGTRISLQDCQVKNVYNSTDDINEGNKSSRFGCVELGPDGKPRKAEKIDQESQKSIKIESEIEKQILGEGLSVSDLKNSDHYTSKNKKNPIIFEQDQLENEIVAAEGDVPGMSSDLSSNLKPSDYSQFNSNLRGFTDAAIFTKPHAVNKAMRQFEERKMTSASPSCVASDQAHSVIGKLPANGAINASHNTNETMSSKYEKIGVGHRSIFRKLVLPGKQSPSENSVSGKIPSGQRSASQILAPKLTFNRNGENSSSVHRNVNSNDATTPQGETSAFGKFKPLKKTKDRRRSEPPVMSLAAGKHTSSQESQKIKMLSSYNKSNKDASKDQQVKNKLDKTGGFSQEISPEVQNRGRDLLKGKTQNMNSIGSGRNSKKTSKVQLDGVYTNNDGETFERSLTIDAQSGSRKIKVFGERNHSLKSSNKPLTRQSNERSLASSKVIDFDDMEGRFDPEEDIKLQKQISVNSIKARIEDQRRRLESFLELARKAKTEKDVAKIKQMLKDLEQTKKPLPMHRINDLKALELMSSPYNQSLIAMIQTEVKHAKKHQEKYKQYKAQEKSRQSQLRQSNMSSLHRETVKSSLQDEYSQAYAQNISSRNSLAHVGNSIANEKKGNTGRTSMNSNRDSHNEYPLKGNDRSFPRGASRRGVDSAEDPFRNSRMSNLLQNKSRENLRSQQSASSGASRSGVFVDAARGLLKMQKIDSGSRGASRENILKAQNSISLLNQQKALCTQPSVVNVNASCEFSIQEDPHLMQNSVGHSCVTSQTIKESIKANEVNITNTSGVYDITGGSITYDGTFHAKK